MGGETKVVSAAMAEPFDRGVPGDGHQQTRGPNRAEHQPVTVRGQVGGLATSAALIVSPAPSNAAGRFVSRSSLAAERPRRTVRRVRGCDVGALPDPLPEVTRLAPSSRDHPSESRVSPELAAMVAGQISGRARVPPRCEEANGAAVLLVSAPRGNSWDLNS